MVSEGNTLTGNYGGVGILDELATGNQVQGNRIGTDLNGAPLAEGPSNRRGVYIPWYAHRPGRRDLRSGAECYRWPAHVYAGRTVHREPTPGP